MATTGEGLQEASLSGHIWAAVEDYAQDIHERDAAENVRIVSYAGLAALQEHVLEEYDRGVLEPNRQLWGDVRQSLVGSVYRSAEVIKGDFGDQLIAWWRFHSPGIEDIGGVAMRVSVDISASAWKSDVPMSLLRLMGTLGHRNRQVSGKQLVEDCRTLSVPLAKRSRLPGGRWQVDAAPSTATIHQKAGETLLKFADSFDAHVYASPAGEESQEVLRATIRKSDLDRPKAISFRPYNRTPLRFSKELSIATMEEFYETWRHDIGDPSAEPALGTMLEYMKKQLPGPQGRLERLASVISLLTGCLPDGAPGKPLTSVYFPPRSGR